jgi:hypothetical protein
MTIDFREHVVRNNRTDDRNCSDYNRLARKAENKVQEFVRIVDTRPAFKPTAWPGLDYGSV